MPQPDRFLFHAVVSLMLGLLPGSVPGWEFATSVRGQEANVRLDLIDGTSRVVALNGVTATGELIFDGNSDVPTLSFLTAIDFSRPVSPASKDSPRILLVGQGELFASDFVMEGEVLAVKSPWITSKVPLDAIQAMIWSDHDRVRSTLASLLPDNDQVVVNTDEGPVVVSGLLEGLNSDKVQVNYQDKSRTISKEKVLAIVMARLREKPVSDEGTQLRILLADGSTLVGKAIELNSTSFTLHLAGGGHISGMATGLARIEIQSDRQVFLSDLAPTQLEQRVLFGESREVARDKGLLGPVLAVRRVDGGERAEFRKGLAMRATTRAVYENSKGFDRLTGLVGLETESALQGDCDVTVRGDGIELWKTRLNSQIPSAKVDVDIRGYALIEIAVLPGEQFDLGDFVDWCNLQFLRTGK